MTKCPTCDGDGKDRDSAMADVACVICSGTGIDPDTESREEFIARAVKNSGYTPEAAAYQWDSRVDNETEYDVDGVYTAQELANDINDLIDRWYPDGDKGTDPAFISKLRELLNEL